MHLLVISMALPQPVARDGTLSADPGHERRTSHRGDRRAAAAIRPVTSSRRRAGRVLASEDFRAGFVEMLPACVAMVPFGIVCGVGAAAAGANFLGAMGMSTIIFSGAAQILASQLLATGAPVAVVILTCSVLGLRFLMYSAAMAPVLQPLPRRWSGALAFLLTDQAFAAAIRKFDAHGDARRAALHYTGGGMALWCFWQATNAAGFLAGNVIPAAWSLEFAVPLCFLALLAPAHAQRAARVCRRRRGSRRARARCAADAAQSRRRWRCSEFSAALAIELARERWKAR